MRKALSAFQFLLASSSRGNAQKAASEPGQLFVLRWSAINLFPSQGDGQECPFCLLLPPGKPESLHPGCSSFSDSRFRLLLKVGTPADFAMRGLPHGCLMKTLTH